MEFVDPVNMDSDYTLGLDNIYPVDEDERLSPKLCSVDMTLEFKNGTFLLKVAGQAGALALVQE